MTVNRKGDATKLDAWARELDGRACCGHQRWIWLLLVVVVRTQDLAIDLNLNSVSDGEHVMCDVMRPRVGALNAEPDNWMLWIKWGNLLIGKKNSNTTRAQFPRQWQNFVRIYSQDKTTSSTTSWGIYSKLDTGFSFIVHKNVRLLIQTKQKKQVKPRLQSASICQRSLTDFFIFSRLRGPGGPLS
jgi:hypothetical protein